MTLISEISESEALNQGWCDDPQEGPITQWRTQDGRHINIKDMSTRHLENTVAMLIRKSSKLGHDPALPYLQDELANRGQKGNSDA